MDDDAPSPEPEVHGSELRGYDGPVIDYLLYIAQGAMGETAEPLVWCRRGVRRGRPALDWVWPPAVDAEVGRLVSGAHPETALDALADVKGIVSGHSRATAVARKWDIVGSPQFDPTVELAQFSTTRSFDAVRATFHAHILTDDPLALVLRGHLWIEASMNELLARSLPRIDLLKDARLSFNQRLALCGALGLVSDSDTAVIKRLNAIRNRLAHQVETNLSEKDQNDLISVASPELLRIAGLDGEREFPAGVGRIVAALVMGLHSRADGLDAQFRYTHYLSESVSRLIEEGPAESTTSN